MHLLLLYKSLDKGVMMERIRGLYPTKVYPTLAFVLLYLNLSDLRTTKKPPS